MRFLKDMKIGTRLTLGFALILLLSMCTTIIGIWRLQVVSDATQNLVSQSIQKERLISTLYGDLRAGILRTIAISRSADAALNTYFLNEEMVANNESMALQKKVASLLISGEEKSLFQKIDEQRKAYQASAFHLLDLKSSGNVEEGNTTLVQEFMPLSKTYQAAVQQLLMLEQREIDRISVEIEHIAKQSRILLLALEGAALILGILCALLLTRSVTKPIKLALDISERVAHGDLTTQIMAGADNEVGRLLSSMQRMNGNLRNIVSNVRSGTQAMSIASNEIALGNQDLSYRTEQQAGALEETAAAMEQLISTVRKNSDSSSAASSFASEAASVAVEGGEAVGQIIQTMGEINTSSKKIVDIISVIDGIAFQTNILALNAAVEAARAGEQGRGFAVVASEVRGLAQRSAAAAKEIKQLIDDSVQRVSNGSVLVERAGGTMDKVVASVQRVSVIVTEINLASRKQADDIHQVNDAITTLDEMTQRNAALVEQAAAAAASMRSEASNLARMVAVFSLGSESDFAMKIPVEESITTAPVPLLG